jgi:hypothetical protein
MKRAGDLAGFAVYLGLGHVRGRPGRAKRLIRSVAVRNQIREAFTQEKKPAGRRPMLLAVGAVAGLTLVRSTRRKRRQTPGPPSVQPATETFVPEPELSSSLVQR